MLFLIALTSQMALTWFDQSEFRWQGCALHHLDLGWLTLPKPHCSLVTTSWRLNLRIPLAVNWTDEEPDDFRPAAQGATGHICLLSTSPSGHQHQHSLSGCPPG